VITIDHVAVVSSCTSQPLRILTEADCIRLFEHRLSDYPDDENSHHLYCHRTPVSRISARCLCFAAAARGRCYKLQPRILCRWIPSHAVCSAGRSQIASAGSMVKAFATVFKPIYFMKAPRMALRLSVPVASRRSHLTRRYRDFLEYRTMWCASMSNWNSRISLSRGLTEEVGIILRFIPIKLI